MPLMLQIATMQQNVDIIKAAVYRGMSNIANYKYDPDKYAERVRDREGWKEIIEEEDE